MAKRRHPRGWSRYEITGAGLLLETLYCKRAHALAQCAHYRAIGVKPTLRRLGP